MSEPNSLYVRVHLSKDAFERFLKSQTVAASHFNDWMPWLGQAEVYGGPLSEQWLAEVSEGHQPGTVEDALAAWVDDGWAMARSVYDEATETWMFGCLQFSENYGEYMVYLPLMRAVEAFKDRAGDDFMVVYPRIWGPTDCHVVCISLSQDGGALCDEFSPRMRAEADGFLQRLFP
ncbi:hypothetical protein [Uliginosibacterium gangwonense]|uniref:hypothetical protein n=1 Tax=Uliginosibacterium gangwonense TaxID=392736 RepID=UPI0012FCB49B|nr:hypothetical protein [Uliginosibacterium gangwonense]